MKLLKDQTGYSQPTISTALADLRLAGHIDVGLSPDGRPHRWRAASNKPLKMPADVDCTVCGKHRGDRASVCSECLPLDPKGLHVLSELAAYIPDAIEMKARLYTERYAAGLPMNPEPYTSPRPMRA